ncbi:MAG: hypothetical protein E6G39_03925 [Actinobacteria bacterium]|nr:MAG: hypothetical protein E6G39_03925 [Actinomycetota bacterium]
MTTPAPMSRAAAASLYVKVPVPLIVGPADAMPVINVTTSATIVAPATRRDAHRDGDGNAPHRVDGATG